MKFTILIETRLQNSLKEICENPDYRNCSLPYEEAPHLIVEGACPCCKDPKPEFCIRGDQQSMVQSPQFVFYCVAYCTDCMQPVGTLQVQSESLFGLEEDQLVLHGRPRVYK